LLDQVRGKIRLKHYSIRTEQVYLDWIKRFILHFDKHHPAKTGAREDVEFSRIEVEGTVRPFGREHDDDLYPCSQPGWPRRHLSAGYVTGRSIVLRPGGELGLK